MDWVFLGPPGCGKGTQVQQLLAGSHGKDFAVVCTGELLRREMREQTQIGKRISDIMNAGLLVDDATVSAVTAIGVAESAGVKHIIFDGYPRSIRQAEDLQIMLTACGRKLGGVIAFRVDEEQLVDRITGRFMCASCGMVYHERHHKPAVEGVCDGCGAREFLKRSDDDANVLRNRLSQYQEKTQPIYEYYAKLGLLSDVDASQPVAQVHAQILKYMQD